MISLLPLLLAGQLLLPDPPVRPRVFRSDGAMRVSRLGSDDYAFFEAFPASGAGTTTACSTTPPTGAKGETLTFARTGNATCTSTATGGLATSGIANGDLVVMTANQPRVEYDSAGTLGLLVESARTNSLVRSESIDNAAWTKAAGATVTADYATAPDGTLTADRLVYNAVSSYVLGSLSTGGLTYTTSVYLRGTSSSGSIDMCAGGAAGQCVVCSYVADSWSRCVWAHTLAIASNFFIGCDVPTKGGACSPAGDVLVWGMQGEAGAYATSYIPTTSAAVTRNAETAYVSLSSPSASQSIAATRNGPTGGSGARVLALTQTNGAATYGIGIYGNSGTGTALLGNTPNTLTAGTLATTTRAWASWDGATFSVNFDGTGNTSSPGASITVRNSLSVGLDTAGGSSGWADGIISRICLDPSPTRCR